MWTIQNKEWIYEHANVKHTLVSTFTYMHWSLSGILVFFSGAESNSAVSKASSSSNKTFVLPAGTSETVAFAGNIEVNFVGKEMQKYAEETDSDRRREERIQFLDITNIIHVWSWYKC